MIEAGRVTNEKLALRKYVRQFRGKEVQVESAGKAARGGSTRQGWPWRRGMMGEAAQVATRSSPAARRYQERLLRKKPKHVARARKRLIAVYVRLHDGVRFDEDKLAAV